MVFPLFPNCFLELIPFQEHFADCICLWSHWKYYQHFVAFDWREKGVSELTLAFICQFTFEELVFNHLRNCALAPHDNLLPIWYPNLYIFSICCRSLLLIYTNMGRGIFSSSPLWLYGPLTSQTTYCWCDMHELKASNTQQKHITVKLSFLI